MFSRSLGGIPMYNNGFKCELCVREIWLKCRSSKARPMALLILRCWDHGPPRRELCRRNQSLTKTQKKQKNPTLFRAKSPIATAFKVKPDMIMDWNFELKNRLGKRTSQSLETQIAISHGAVARLLPRSLCNAWSCMNWKSSLTTKTVHPSNKIIKIKHKQEHDRTKSHINLALAKRWQISSLDSWRHDI